MTALPSAPNAPTLLGQRYRLLEPLGSGGMGTIHRALDRLTGQYVALKRVQDRQPTALTDSKIDVQTELRIALAQEFEILSSLRHPNIVTVMDYGFDHNRQPFYTMELLDNPKTIHEAGMGQSLSVQVDLLIQLLRALSYLHKRGILHRDVKPGNVMVVNGQVKTLDFGLSSERERSQSGAGTLAYMAPEVLQGQDSAESADLYSVGIIAYELLVGQHPFSVNDTNQLIKELLVSDADITPILRREARELAARREQLLEDGFDLITQGPLSNVVRKLLQKDPAGRYKYAHDVIADLSLAIEQPPALETEQTRDSALQAARFVGRDAELAWLAAALSASINGRGGGWLIGGESGVGKSRLVREVWTLALVWESLPLFGQAVNEGGAPYDAWRDILRRLVLSVDLSDFEAGVLKALVPDIADLLERPIQDPPQLDRQTAQSRLFTTIGDVIKRHTKPLLIILEDMHWADSGSLLLLKWLMQYLANRPVLVLVTYRDDEHTDMPKFLPQMRTLKLQRLDEEAIAALSASMLGPVGKQPQVVNFLQRETDGNVFVLIETMRMLAEESGALEHIGFVTLPETVLAGGLQRIVKRRLDRLPADALPLLQAAAVDGRAVDPAVLRRVDPQIDLDRWLTQCVNATVLEAKQGRWRFIHDKLREGVLATLEPSRKQALHGQIANAIAEAHAADLTAHYADLALHYREAGDTTHELQYVRLAGEQALLRFENTAGIAYLSRALELTPEADTQARFHMTLARVQAYNALGERTAERRDLDTLETLAEQLGKDECKAEVACLRSNFLFMLSEYPASEQAAEKSIHCATAVGAAPIEAEGHYHFGRALMRRGCYPEARQHIAQAIEVASKANLPGIRANALRILGNISLELGNYEESRSYYLQSQIACREIGDKRSEAHATNNLGEVGRLTGNYALAKQSYEAALTIFRDITKDRQFEGMVMGNLGLIARNVGNYSEARAYNEQALVISREIENKYAEFYALLGLGQCFDDFGDYKTALNYYEQALALVHQTGERDGEGWTLAALGILYHHMGEEEKARDYSQQTLALAREQNAKPILARALMALGHAQAALDMLDEAAAAYQESLTLRRAIGEEFLAIEVIAGLARVALAKNDLPTAQAHVETILTYLQTHSVNGMEEPVRVYLSCYQVLERSGSSRAADILSQAHKLLQDRAAGIKEDALRQSFLDNVLAHFAVITAWRRQHPAPVA